MSISLFLFCFDRRSSIFFSPTSGPPVPDYRALQTLKDLLPFFVFSHAEEKFAAESLFLLGARLEEPGGGA